MAQRAVFTLNYAMNVFPCADVSSRVRGKTLSVNGGYSIIGHRLYGLEAVNAPPPRRGPVWPAGGEESSLLSLSAARNLLRQNREENSANVVFTAKLKACMLAQRLI